MTLGEINCRVGFASQYSSSGLSRMLQRIVRKMRSESISEYLLSNEERFFPAMIVAVFGGKPKWISISISEDHGKPKLDVSVVDGPRRDRMGVLVLSGDEQLFALDGQHRLSGIRKAIRQPEAEDLHLEDDEMTVIFVAHEETDIGRIRSRRLFTTLNKRAVPVTKQEIIALDEDDAMAIATRRLSEEFTPFKHKIDFFRNSANTPSTNTSIFITVATIYDTLCELFQPLTGISKRS